MIDIDTLNAFRSEYHVYALAITPYEYRREARLEITPIGSTVRLGSVPNSTDGKIMLQAWLHGYSAGLGRQ